MAEVLVTGASGFLGSSVVRSLTDAGRSVAVLVEPGSDDSLIRGLPVETRQGDIRDQDAVFAAVEGCEVIYHLAAIYKIWTDDPDSLYDVNVMGTANVLLAAREFSVRRIVYTSSIAAVGHSLDRTLSDETTVFNGWRTANDYVKTKVLAERLVLSFAGAGLPITVVNPGFPFGPGDIGPTPTGDIVVKLLKKKLPACFKGGFSAIDVDDVAAGHLLAEEHGRIGERYLLVNHNVTYREFFDMVGEEAGVEVPKRNLPRSALLGIGLASEKISDLVSGRHPLTTFRAMQYATRYLYFDNSKARRELGLPSRPLIETVSRSVEWFRGNGYA